MFYILGVHKKVFGWLDLNELLTNSKNYFRLSCIYLCFLFLQFLCNNFFLLIKISNTSVWRKIHSIKLSGSGNQVFCQLAGEIFRYERWCVWFWFFENFLRSFILYEFSVAIFINVLRMGKRLIVFTPDK